jgi:hypothetical protein
MKDLQGKTDSDSLLQCYAVDHTPEFAAWPASDISI